MAEKEYTILIKRSKQVFWISKRIQGLSKIICIAADHEEYLSGPTVLEVVAQIKDLAQEAIELLFFATRNPES